MENLKITLGTSLLAFGLALAALCAPFTYTESMVSSRETQPNFQTSGVSFGVRVGGGPRRGYYRGGYPGSGNYYYYRGYQNPYYYDDYYYYERPYYYQHPYYRHHRYRHW